MPAQNIGLHGYGRRCNARSKRAAVSSRTALGRLLGAALTLSTIAGCGGGNGGNGGDASLQRASAEGAGMAAASTAFTTALIGGSSGISVRETVVVRDSGQWDALWARHASLMVPLPPAPAQDFNGRQMVGVFLGSRPDGCYSVAVTAVAFEAAAIVVRYRERRADSAGACTLAITQPHHLVWLPASTLPVEFKAD